MLSKMLTEMFNETEQKMLEYSALYYLSSYYEYHVPLTGSDIPNHIPKRLSADQLAKVFNVTEEYIREFFIKLEEKNIGKITIYKVERGSILEKINDEKVIVFNTVQELTDDKFSKDTIWFFDFNQTVLEQEAIKPMVDELLNKLLSTI